MFSIQTRSLVPLFVGDFRQGSSLIITCLGEHPAPSPSQTTQKYWSADNE